MAPADPIDALVARQSKTHGMWLNGISPVLELPAETPVEELVATFFQKVAYEQGPVTRHAVEEIRKVQITNASSTDEYTAVLVETNLGRKILLLRYSPRGGWWSRIYDA